MGITETALVIDANDPASPPHEAHLRWFILSDAARGHGIGQQLMQAALDHVDRLGLGCWLTTFAGLDAASWGVNVREQLFRRPAQR